MNNYKLLVALLFCCGAATASAQLTDFTAGDLVIYQVGNGTSTLTSAAASIFLDEYTTSGVLVGSVAVPSTGSNAITASGTATSEGLLTLSGDGASLAFTGYNTPVGTSGPASSTTIARAVGTISYDTTQTFDSLGASVYSGNNIRGAYTTDGTNIWTVGAGSGTNGVWYTNGGPAVNLVGGGLRAINSFNGQIYVDSGSNIQTLSGGEPTSGTQTLTNLPGAGISGTGNAFVLFDLPGGVGLDTLYVGNATAIQKFSLVSGSWVNSGNISVTSGAFGLTGEVVGSDVELFGTNGTSLFSLTDSSGYDSTFSGTVATLATAGTNEAFRGVAFAPSSSIAVPEPGVMSLIFGAGCLTTAFLCLRRKKAALATVA